jgi:protein-L-isoaspartate(D-aspartate) O-methyltransferase
MISMSMLGLMFMSAIGAACASGRGDGKQTGSSEGADPQVQRRHQMVATQIEARGVGDPLVLDAMRSVPRDRFVRKVDRSFAYSDGPLPIGYGQTISQPYIVALMTELLRPDDTMKVLEIGTGSGYQAAVLAEIVDRVYTIEIVPELGASSKKLLAELGYENIQVRVGDGFAGWPEEAPFDAVIVTAAPAKVPQPLLDQLKVGGRLVIPVGKYAQDLVLITRTETGYDRRSITGVRFVPMTGEAEKKH